MWIWMGGLAYMLFEMEMELKKLKLKKGQRKKIARIMVFGGIVTLLIIAFIPVEHFLKQ